MMWKSRWYLLSLSTTVLVTLQLLHNPSVIQSQMVAVSPVIDHEVSKSKVHSTDKDTTTSEKSKVHTIIAQEHLEQHERLPNDKEQDKPVHDKVIRKDKPTKFQNPAKHASDEFLLTFLLEQYKLSSDNVDEQLEILQNLEHFSHKYENGRDLFGSTNALKEILLPALNSSSIDIRKSACSIFAIAGQNNGLVQSKSSQAGVVRHLIHLVSSDVPVRPKALFAISSILRNYPDAQKKFIQDGGVLEIIKIAFLPETRRRGLTFLMDLINERKFCKESPMPRTKQLEEDELKELSSDDPCDQFDVLGMALEKSGWCQLLSDSVENLHSFGTEDQIVVIGAVGISLDICSSNFSNLIPYFHQLLVKFGSDVDFKDTKDTLESILGALSSPTISVPRIEL